ncbi:MAG: energy-coupling factor transporter transmembrane protein EcfT [Anaerolineae bacterium]|nr:energy-coupling factor transporter transmembrane protein EcfT [Anaerolineae bacterium]
MTIALSGVATSLIVSGVWGNYLLFLLILVPLSAWGQITYSFLRAVFRVVWPFAISIFLIQGLFWTDGTPVIDLGPLSFKAEGLLFAVISVGRILLLVGSFTLMTMSTRPDALMIALNQRGLPHTLSYVVLSAIQIVPMFQAKANKIVEAQQSRGLETSGNLLKRVRALLPLVEPLLLGSILDIEERAIALEARGFGRRVKPTSLLILKDPVWEKILRWAIVALVLALLAVRIWLW